MVLYYLCCCCCLPSETYGRNVVTLIFRYFFTELPVPPQAAGVVGTFNVLDIYILLSTMVSHFLDLMDAIIFSIKVVYDLEVLFQLDAECGRVDCYFIYTITIQIGFITQFPAMRTPFPFLASWPCTAAKLMTWLFIKGHC